MSADMFGMLIDKGIPFAGGIYMTLLGFRIIGKKPGESDLYDNRLKMAAPILKVCGPLLIVTALLQILLRLMFH